MLFPVPANSHLGHQRIRNARSFFLSRLIAYLELCYRTYVGSYPIHRPWVS